MAISGEYPIPTPGPGPGGPVSDPNRTTNSPPGPGGLPGWLKAFPTAMKGLGSMFGGGNSNNYPSWEQGGMAQNALANLRDQNIQPQNQTLWNNYLTANDLGRQQQSDLMGGYQNVAQNAGAMFNPAYQGFSGMAFGNAGGFDPEFRGGLSSALGGYQNFADTGGLSAQNQSDIRARGVAPIRSVYAGVQRDLERQKALHGGYSPNAAALKVKTARDLASGLADASTNVEAGLAEQIRSGKLAGLGGMSQTSATGQGLQTAIDSLNSQSRLAGLSGMGQMAGAMGNMQLGALGGAANVYGSAPGLANMAGNQMLTSSGQLVDVGQQQNQLALGRMGLDVERNRNKGPSKLSQILGAVPGVGGFFSGLFPGGSGGGYADNDVSGYPTTGGF